MEKGNHPVLEIKGLEISFKQYSGLFKQVTLHTIRNLDVTVPAGKIVAVVGSSGSGKSLLAHAVLGILPYNATMGGSMLFEGEPLTGDRIKKLRGNEICIVPQSTSYMDPLMKIGPQVRNGANDSESRRRQQAIFENYHLDKDVENLYPFELSGGMTRRVMISTAMMKSPKLVIADEPTPGLHISVAKRVMSHFRDLADQGAGVLVITHDLELARETADEIYVFYAGTTIEHVKAEAFFDGKNLCHPYSRALWEALPENGFKAIAGTQPYVKDMPQGCPFGPRCDIYSCECAGDIDWHKTPCGSVRCVHYHKDEEVPACD